MMLCSSSYDDQSQDLMLFSDPFPLFFTSCSDPIDDIVYQGNHEEQSPNLESDQLTYLSALECQIKMDGDSETIKMESDISTFNNHQQHVPLSYVGDASASQVMQRSSSCNSFDGNSAILPYIYEVALSHTTLMNSPNYQWHDTSGSIENSFFTGQLRRVFSAGDLQYDQKTKVSHTFQSESRSLIEEANFNKVGRYSAEERKEKISKYRAKRSQRKFNKTIKYACRKTLADNRARIRGRFARNHDATFIIPKPAEENQDQFWIDLIEGLNDNEVLS